MSYDLELHRRVNRLGGYLGVPQHFNQDPEEASVLFRRLDRYIESVLSLEEKVRYLEEVVSRGDKN